MHSISQAIHFPNYFYFASFFLLSRMANCFLFLVAFFTISFNKFRQREAMNSNICSFLGFTNDVKQFGIISKTNVHKIKQQRRKFLSCALSPVHLFIIYYLFIRFHGALCMRAHFLFFGKSFKIQ